MNLELLTDALTSWIQVFIATAYLTEDDVERIHRASHNSLLYSELVMIIAPLFHTLVFIAYAHRTCSDSLK